MTMQVWANIQKNCEITDELVPAVNMTGVGSGSNFTYVATDYTNCSQIIELPTYIAGDNYITCNNLSVQYSIPSASLLALNNAYNCAALSGSFCAPQSCNITVNTVRQNLKEFASAYTNLTTTQLLHWNPFMVSLSSY